MRTALVTGGSGFIGAHLVERLGRETDLRVLAPTREAFNLERDSLPYLGPIDIVVHLAASRTRKTNDTSREQSINMRAAERLYSWAIAHRAKHLIHLSTLSVFAPAPAFDGIIDEGSPKTTSDAPYAATKRKGEVVAREFTTGVESLAIVRPGFVYGPGQPAHGAVARMITDLKQGVGRELSGPNGNCLSPVHVADVVDILASLIRDPSSCEINIGGPNALSERAMLESLGALMGKLPIITTHSTTPISYALSTEAIDKQFPDRLRTPWSEGIRTLSLRETK